jgi:hypothetical protein
VRSPPPNSPSVLPSTSSLVGRPDATAGTGKLMPAVKCEPSVAAGIRSAEVSDEELEMVSFGDIVLLADQ